MATFYSTKHRKIGKIYLILLSVILVLLYFNVAWMKNKLRLLFLNSKGNQISEQEVFDEFKELSRRSEKETFTSFNEKISNMSEKYKSIKSLGNNQPVNRISLGGRISSITEYTKTDLPKIQNRGKLLQKRLPKCIIIGMKKAGTGALGTFLELNNRIKTTKHATTFFNNDENYNKGYDWYKKQMPLSYENQITIEKSPGYIIYDKVPERILKMNASIKLILIVKEPIRRALSDYVHECTTKKINSELTFEEYALKRITGEVNADFRHINKSIYYQYMPKWIRIFPRQQIHIVDGDKLIDTPFQELNKIETFLGLKTQITKDMFHYNITKGFYCAKRDEFSYPVCLEKDKGRKHPYVSPAVIKKLREFFKPWNELFFQIVGQRFDW